MPGSTPTPRSPTAGELVADGADLLDVGGESTRPGAQRPTVEEELRRVLPVVAGLADVVPVSIDTMRAEVAAAALDAGAVAVNDVSGGLADPAMVPLLAERDVPVVAMHWRGHSDDMYAPCGLRRRRRRRVPRARRAGGGADRRPGWPRDRIAVDPGFGFAKTAEHNWELLRRLDEVVAVGPPVLVATSRKTFLGRVGREPGHERAPLEREVATAVTTVHAARHGVWCVRVHDVAPRSTPSTWPRPSASRVGGR